MNSTSVGVCTFFLEGPRGSLMAVYYPPEGKAHPLGDVLVAPAFAEEMNRCRSMVSMQAREFARIGIGTLILDPLGTGDSAGDFGEATWAMWREDLQAGARWLRAHGNGCRMLWGIRLGAIMAVELAVADPGIERLLFWQPVVDGKQFFTQFLRSGSPPSWNKRAVRRAQISCEKWRQQKAAFMCPAIESVANLRVMSTRCVFRSQRAYPASE